MPEIEYLLALPRSTVYHTLQHEPGSFNDTSTRSGRPRALTRDDVEFILEVCEIQPNIYLDELKEELELQNVDISLAALCRYLHRNGITHKRLARIARERDHARRALFVDTVQQYDAAQLVSVDEAAVDTRNMTRNFGWSYSGVRASERVPLERGIRYSVLPALSLDGVLHVNIVEGSFNAITFRHFIHTLLDRMNPFPAPNSVILLDNASIHHSEETLDMIVERGMRYIFLPPYSPDLQPIEELFHELKEWIRRNYIEGRAAMRCTNSPAHPWVFLMEGLDHITPDDAYGFFKDTGYIQ
ncbi:hypothetical protein SCP_0508860 [Sparassis crispa]|uniref:Tc1-like transposase DDE domain-containing protein n=2 Tax=Sparassis crispa TaxID=139825 RepID=A0A401GNV4_9APHY|nr:hypothetical protein SCP_0508860 [Sparassis crispa]GBE83829.1 hypothetical protein SCP_0508860 [Sparassis crispa]